MGINQNLILVLIGLVLVNDSSRLVVNGFGTYGFDIHHRYSDKVKGILDIDDNKMLPNMGSVDYYASMSHRDRLFHRRRLAGVEDSLVFLDGNETYQLPSLGFCMHFQIASQTEESRSQPSSDLPFEYCYDISPNQNTFEAPSLNLTMKGGDQFSVTNPFVVVPLENGGSVFCLGIAKSDNVNIIGQNFMTGYRVVFDREKNILGWKASDCYNVIDSNTLPISPQASPSGSPRMSLGPEATSKNGSPNSSPGSCDLSGVYQDKRRAGTKRKKSTGSRLTDCPFQITGKKGSDGVWVFKVKNLAHNHDPSTDMSGHQSFRRLELDDVQTVKKMSLSGIPPRQILSTLRQQNPNLPAISRTIYNLKAKFRKDDLGNRSAISLLFEELQKGGFSHDILHNPDGYITGLFIAHPLSIKLAKLFSNTFVMDCTYKTNRYNMPLLDIIGVTCFNTSFYSGFVFLEKEDKDHYVWALSVFKKILGDSNQPSVIIQQHKKVKAAVNG
ncbi:protein FAR1-RELATED SEQUENCE 5 [Artemisia annua]|uniref:Protein FAR1-RELATED SEQUENCE 5 n=1 Tax=Artemisia annua TaxID=35608 RepID=A0A2U1LXS6_ARTAN|nr:protein FAR1-RELATED SEQUENCE 5 [Artemisia annua]